MEMRTAQLVIADTNSLIVAEIPLAGDFCVMAMIELSPMTTKYINAIGEIKEAELSVEQVEALKKKGVKVFERTRIHVGESICNGCEG